MKKTIYITITLSMIALAAVFTFTHTTSTADRLLMENVEALADGWDSLQSFNDDPEGGGGTGKCPTGGMANTKCNYWKVTVTYSFPWPTTTCETEGSHKCAEGKCPHGN